MHHPLSRRCSAPATRNVLALLLIWAGFAQAQTLVQLTTTWPQWAADLSLEIASGQPLYLVIAYETTVPVTLYAAPLRNDDVIAARSEPSPVLLPGQGETLLSLSLEAPRQIDGVRISYRVGNSSTETALATVPVDVMWSDQGQQTASNAPPWLLQLQQQVLAQLVEENQRQASSAFLWNFFITLIVIAVPGSIAWLTWASVRLWRGYWRIMAATPLVILAVWTVVIILSNLSGSPEHRMWPFEIFIWAMATVVYLVVLMTAKRTFARAEAE